MSSWRLRAATARKGVQNRLFAPIMIPGRKLMSKGTSMKKDQKKPKKKR